MKKFVLILIIFLIASSLWAQQKYALVIGNQAYTNISQLKNPVNDANDMADTLKTLGFDVQKVLDGNLKQMKEAVTNFSQRLHSSNNSYGFFFYAGHGVQSKGENYLIPVGEKIEDETDLEYHAVPLGYVLSKLEEAGNELNLIVLDACRNNPFSFSRGGSRGLSVVSHSPPGSITMYATSADSIAQDGNGKNGIFTGCLLNNLKLPDLEVVEVFKKTMRDVEDATDKKQRPAMYDQFSGKAYLGSRPPQNKATYLIGERGPAGGLIFYDKGKTSDGWRYLEAAPADKEIPWSKWGTYGYDVPGTKMDLGSGKSNTSIINDYLKSINEIDKATQLCTLNPIGGFSDWFLPSLEELNLMYLNLHKEGNGGFKNERYWSSSQYDSTHAWYRHFGDNGRASHDKDKNRSGWVLGHNIIVRPIRAF